MKTLQFTEAKARLSEVLDEVERGEVVEITRHGRTVARIVPEIDRRRERIERTMKAMEELRRSAPATGLTIDEIREMRHEGHRY